MIWRGETLTTWGELTKACARIASTGDRDEAQLFLDAYASEVHGWKKAREEFGQPDGSMGMTPREIAESNVGYLSGYCDQQTAIDIREVFDVAHPITGKQGAMSPEELVEAGRRWALGEMDSSS